MNIHDVRQHIISMHIIKNRIGEERRKYAEKCADLTIWLVADTTCTIRVRLVHVLPISMHTYTCC